MTPRHPATPLRAGADDRAALPDVEALYALHADNTTEIITLYDLEGHRVYVSPSCVRVLGELPEETLAGVHPDDLSAARDAWARVLAGQKVSLTYRHSRADGSWRWLTASAWITDFRGRPHVIAVSRDVTERRRAEKKHRVHLKFLESLDKVNRAMQATNDLEQMMSDVLAAVLGIFDCDRAWLIYPCDPDAASWHVPMERTRPDYPGALVGAEMPTSPAIAAVLRIVSAAPGPVQFGPARQHQLPSDIAEPFGVQSQIVMAIDPKVDKPYAFGLHQCSHPRVWSSAEQRLFQEIGRRLADTLSSLLMFRTLRESERRLAEAERIAHIGWWDVDLETGRIDSSDEAYRIYGLPPEARVDRMAEWDAQWQRLIHPQDRARVSAAMSAALRAGGPYDTEYRVIRPDGTLRILHSRAEVTRDASGRPRRTFGAIQDVTELRHAEQALLESFSLLSAVVEGTSDAVFVKDLQSRYLMINSAGARFIGKSVGEVIGKDDDALFPPDAARGFMERDRDVMRSGGSHNFEETVSVDGVTRTYLTTKTAYRAADGEVIGLIGIASDVTERKRLEEQLRQSQKMEAIGRLAGGVAHDFNNLLTVINSYSEIVFNSLDADDPNREPLTEIMRSGERAANLTRQLLAFGRKQLLQPQVVDLNRLLGDLLGLLRRLIGEDIELMLLPEAALGRTRVDPGQFEQAIINLAVNARDAMPKGGRLTIATRNVALAEGDSTSHAGIRPGQYVAVSVTDAGEGMDEATKSRVFEPFFTTKGPGKGSGLGLAMVYGFVTQSGGFIDVESCLGGGTSFTVYLPRVDEPVSLPVTAADAGTLLKGTETVLVVEDEDPVRALARIVLQGAGYTVLEARDGEDALVVARLHRGPIHLLVTDLVMPRMSGRRLAAELGATRPGMHVLFMSGYPHEHVVRDGALEPGVAFLQKPFTPSDLTRKIREVLQQADNRRH